MGKGRLRNGLGATLHSEFLLCTVQGLVASNTLTVFPKTASISLNTEDLGEEEGQGRKGDVLCIRCFACWDKTL